MSHPISIAWQAVPHSEGAFASWSDDQRARDYQRLLEPDDRIYLAGEHLSYWTAWQEGAVLSAHEGVVEGSSTPIGERL